MIANLPQAPGGYTQAYMTQFIQRLTWLFARVVPLHQASRAVILQSPNGKSWDVTIDDLGAIVVVENTGMINPEGGHPP